MHETSDADSERAYERQRSDGADDVEPLDAGAMTKEHTGRIGIIQGGSRDAIRDVKARR